MNKHGYIHITEVTLGSLYPHFHNKLVELFAHRATMLLDMYVQQLEIYQNICYVQQLEIYQNYISKKSYCILVPPG